MALIIDGSLMHTKQQSQQSIVVVNYVLQSIPTTQKAHLSICFVVWAGYSVASSPSTPCARLLLHCISLYPWREPDLSGG